MWYNMEGSLGGDCSEAQCLLHSSPPQSFLTGDLRYLHARPAHRRRPMRSHGPENVPLKGTCADLRDKACALPYAWVTRAALTQITTSSRESLWRSGIALISCKALSQTHHHMGGKHTMIRSACLASRSSPTRKPISYLAHDRDIQRRSLCCGLNTGGICSGSLGSVRTAAEVCALT